MNDETEFGYKVRQVLNQSLNGLDGDVATRLHEARQHALVRQRQTVRGLSFASIGHSFEIGAFPYARTVVAVLALMLGASGTYYWNAFEQAREYEEIDSALLVDELPPSAYLDRGFHAWLDRSSDSSSQ